MQINDFIRNIPDYPKPGINFKDITPLLLDPVVLQQACRDMAHSFLEAKVDYIAGIESRGFIFGVPIALFLNAGFIPIRKPGKLPGPKIREEYSLEYGTDAVEMHVDHFKKGARILIVDDLLATGGTAAAASRLVQQAGGVVCGLTFLIELSFLKGRDVLGNFQIASILRYE